MLLTVAAFVFVLGVLIFVHEAGHFLVAKATGVQVLRFSLGFGKPLVHFKWGETEYVIAALPFGGYVKMAGLEEEGMMGEVEGGASTVPVDPERAFDRKPLVVRSAVMLAGVTMNFLFAWCAYSVLAGTVGSSHTDTTQVDSVLVGQLPHGAEGLGALRRGDRIIAVNGDTVRSWEGLQEAMVLARPPLYLTIKGRGAPLTLQGPQRAEDRATAVEALIPEFPAIIDTVLPGTAAANAGLRAGDRVIGLGSDTIVSWAQVQRAIRGSAHVAMTWRVRRGDSAVVLLVTPGAQRDSGAGKGSGDSVGYAGVAALVPQLREQFRGVAAVGEGWRQSVGTLRQVAISLRMLVTREASVRDLGGPIAIGKMSGKAARGGVASLFQWMAWLSVNLALLNLLPIPILDGGQLVFLIAEGVRRRPLSLDLRLRLTQVGFIFIVVLMLFVVGNDLIRYVLH